MQRISPPCEPEPPLARRPTSSPGPTLQLRQSSALACRLAPNSKLYVTCAPSDAYGYSTRNLTQPDAWPQKWRDVNRSLPTCESPPPRTRPSPKPTSFAPQRPQPLPCTIAMTCGPALMSTASAPTHPR